MNQILSLGEKEKTDVKKIVQFFSIVILAFGLILAIEGTYGLIKNNSLLKQIREANKETTLPVAEIVKDGELVKIIVSHDKVIDKLLYTWNQGQYIQVDGKGRTYFEEEVPLPEGNNELKVVIRDINGTEASYTRDFIVMTESDTTKPQVRIEDPGEVLALRIVAIDDVELMSVKYRWNDNVYIDIEITEDNLKRVEQLIEIELGENTLEVVAVDASGNETIETKDVKTTATRPKIAVTQQGDKLVIKGTDEKEMRSLEYYLNGQKYIIDTDYMTKEIEYTQSLERGENTFKLTIYNKEGVTATHEATYKVD